MNWNEFANAVGTILSENAYFGLFISVGAYALGARLKKRFHHALFNPLLIAILIVAAVLKLFHVDYAAYNKSASYLSYLLTPATICLAIPLYRQFEAIRRNWRVVLAAIATGVCANCAIVFCVAKLFDLRRSEYVTLFVKSITTAIGMGVTEELGGDVAIAVVTIILTGLTGAVLGETFLKFFRVADPMAKGLAIGVSSHAIGTARALEIGETEGASSGLAVALTGILTAILAPFFAGFLD